MIKSFLGCLVFLFVAVSDYSQLTVVNVNFNEFNVSNSSLSQITLNNVSGEGVVRVEGTLTNSANEVILSTVSEPINIQTGVNVFGSHNLSFNQFNFSSSSQGDYLKNMHRLPSGAFNYCIRVIPITGIEEGDEYCQSIDASMDEQMFLINPYDEEQINTTTPILIWSHTEPFNILAEGEFFRLKLTEIYDDQEAAEAISVNTPVFTSDYLEKHQVQYPFDAEKLESGKCYAWQVEKISNGNIIASTEVWEFSLESNTGPSDIMYVELKKKLDGSIYTPQDDRIYFRYDERYQAKELICKIYSDKREELVPQLENEQKEAVNTKNAGYNSYELDLKPYKLKKGYYTLEVINEKGDVFKLKFEIE